jgi:glycosyltransferase involved in cell wall biosynthesis
MKKLLYIAPHLSTGGLPQYLTKKIELLRDSFDIYVVEWSNHTGGVLVVQRDKITSMVAPDKFFTLEENKMQLIDIINQVSPDIIHLEEIPEYFMDFGVAKEIYKKDRNYVIVETSHDSSYDATQKKFFPDKFMFVSDWQIKLFDSIDIPKVLVEYPIEYKQRPNREDALRDLGLDPSKKHILHVGLFTPRKNQKEFFEYAKSLPDYVFHSVGNQAGNFAHYWEPLMKDKPENVVWHGERKDVDRFYQAMDLFLFTSRGTDNDKETMPLVIREAISWNLPILIYNLGVYLNYFDKFDNIKYLDFSDFNKNCSLITEVLENSVEFQPKTKEINREKEAIIISTYPTTKSVFDTTVECILAAKRTGRKVILTSHLPISLDLQNLADYCIYDKNNILTKHTFYSQSRYSESDFFAFVNLRGEGNDVYHGPTCYTNYYNGAALANELGMEKVYFLNYDYVLKNDTYLDNISNVLETKSAYFGDMPNNPEGHSVTTFFMGIKPSFYLDTVEPIFDAQGYENLRTKWGSFSNGYENMMYFAFKDKMNQIELVGEEQFKTEVATNFHHRDYSRVEYFTVLPTNIPNSFAVYFQVSNSVDSRIVNITINKNGSLLREEQITVTGRGAWYNMVGYNLNENAEYTIDYQAFDKDTQQFIESKCINIDNNYITNVLPNNGMFEYKGDYNSINLLTNDDPSKPKIRIVHLVTEPTTNPKELRSAFSLKDFANTFDNVEYYQKVNLIYKDLPPVDTCNRPHDVAPEPGYFKLSPGHYGCFLAHKNGITLPDNDKYDFVLVFEGDALIDTPYQELYDNLIRWSQLAKEENVDMVGFGNYLAERYDGKREDLLLNLSIFAPAHAYLINREKLPTFVERFETCKWDAFDLWMTKVAKLHGAMADKIYVKQLAGYSLIDKKDKNKDNDYYPAIFTN